MKILPGIAAATLLAATPVLAASAAWPDLPKTGFISGRPATPKDVTLGNAAFSMSGQSLGAIPVAIPQYVSYKYAGKVRPAVLLQAERGPAGMDMAAIRYADGSQEVVLFSSLTLLGKTKPR